jgi:hypothetical protein
MIDLPEVSPMVPSCRTAAVVAMLAALACARSAKAQSAASKPSNDQAVKVWASLDVGQISVTSRETAAPFPQQAGELSLWATRGPLAASIRAAGTLSEVGPGAGDVSVLVGVHAAPVRHIDAVAAIGVGQSGASQGSQNFANEPVLAASAQVNLNFYVIGLAFDAFGAIGSTRHYAGFGLGLGLGWFH